jgi:hypothetical protein
MLAHRFAWRQANACEIPPGRYICHSCDNPPCCNPSHLFLATPKDNAQDKSRKGRAPHGEDATFARLNETSVRTIYARYAAGEISSDIARDFQISSSLVSAIARGDIWRHLKLLPIDGTGRKGWRAPKGDSHGQAKLTAEHVIAIRARYAAGERQPILARDFGVSRPLVSLIVTRRVWNHI